MFAENLISIHAPLAGCDPRPSSPPPCTAIFQSTHPLRGATRAGISTNSSAEAISIHAPLAGCDRCPPVILGSLIISIHAPLAGCDRSSLILSPIMLPSFQSTHPLRGATDAKRLNDRHTVNFNPRTPCGVRRVSPLVGMAMENISIHAPLAGCDQDEMERDAMDGHFNPRTPCGVRQQKRTKKTALFLN